MSHNRLTPEWLSDAIKFWLTVLGLAVIAGLVAKWAFTAGGDEKKPLPEATPSPSVAAKPSPTPGTPEEWYQWFSDQKSAVVKSDTTVREGRDVRPLLSEITLSDAKLLPAGIWGVRKYRRYIAGPGGLWNQGTFYELIKTAEGASAKSSAISWEAVVSKDAKYCPPAGVVAK